MDPITGVAVLAGISLASLAGLRLKKSSQEGFAVLPAQQGTESYPGSIERSQTRYNEFTSMINPGANSLIPVGSPPSVIETVRQTLMGAMGYQDAKYSPNNALHLQLQKMSNKYPIRADGRGSLFEGIRFCQETGKLEQPFGVVSPDGIWKFSEHCGVCLNGGIDEYGKAFRDRQGMIVDPTARAAATAEKERRNYPYVQIGPSLGTCKGSPDTPVFAVNREDLAYFSKRLACLNKKNIDPEHKCGVCYGTTNFFYVDPDAETQPVFIFLRGLGTAKVFVNDVEVGSLTLNETSTQRVELTNIKEGNKLSITVTNPGVGTASLYGYFQSTNPNGGTFTMPLNLLFVVDDETGSTPVKAGGFYTFQDLNLETAKIRPATGKRQMRLRGSLPFTFLDPNDAAAYDCPTAPYQTKTESLSAFAQDQPCFVKGATPGNYSAECLRARILEAGCTNGGDLYKNPLPLNVDENGRPRNLNSIYDYLAGIASKDLVEEVPTKLCSGRTIESPCDAFANNPNLPMRTTPGARKCLSFLYNNEGLKKPLGATYSASTGYINKMNNMNNLFCLPSGLLNPDTSEAAYQTLASIADNPNGYTDTSGKRSLRLDAVKAFLNDRLNLAINTSIDANTNVDRKQAIRDCFGPDLRNLPTALLTEPKRLPTSCGFMARYVRMIPQQSGTVEHIQIAQIVVIDSTGQNVSEGKVATAKGQWAADTPPSRAVDGNEMPRAHPFEYHTEWNMTRDSFWMLDLGKMTDVTAVIYYNRTDCCSFRASGQRIQLLDENKNIVTEKTLTGEAIQRLEFRNTASVADPATCKYELAIPSGHKPGLYSYYYTITKDVPAKDPYTSTSGWKGDALLKQGPVTSVQIRQKESLPQGDRVGLVLKGYYNATGSGWVRFRFSYDDGFTLIFNNQPIFPDDWREAPDRTTETSRISISQPGSYPIEVRFFQNYGSANFNFFWESSSEPGWKEDLSKRFSYDTTASTPRAIPAPAKVFRETKRTVTRGGGGGGPHSFLCPDGAFVNRFEGADTQGNPTSYTNYMSRIGLTCTDGTRFSPMGGYWWWGGLPFEVSSADGFRGLNVRSGSLVDRIEFLNSQNIPVRSSGGLGGFATSLDCGPDEKIKGVNVRTGSMVDNIQVVCGKPQ